MNLIGSAVLVLGAVGAVFGVGLAFAGHKFKVEVDPRVSLVREALAGANCGACGFPGCDGLAEAIVEGRAPCTACPPGGAKAAEMIAKIMGLDPEPGTERLVAQLMCGGDCEHARQRSLYDGIEDCNAAQFASGGTKACSYGCLGFGSCVAVCPFDAMVMGEDGLPIIDREKCTACGNCVKACPRGLIELVPESKMVHVRCKNPERGATVRTVCDIGCIACRLCVRTCPTGAMQFENNLAFIDYALCDNCGLCAEKCPTKAILNMQLGSAEHTRSA